AAGVGSVLVRSASEPGVLKSTMGSDGSGADLLMIPGGGSRYASNGRNGSNSGGRYLRMNGPQIFRWATQMMSRAAEQVMKESGLEPEGVDLLIPHQANLRIIESTARR